MPTDPSSKVESSGGAVPHETAHAQPSPPVDVRNVSLALLALLASVFALHWASAVFIPLLLGVMFSYALTPVVDWLQRWHVPRVLGAAALLVVLLGGLGVSAYRMSDDATALFDSLPDAAQKLREPLRAKQGAPAGAIQNVQKAAAKLEEATEESTSASRPASKGVTRVQIERPPFNIKDYLWSGTLGLAGAIVQAMVVLFITYFLLVSGDSFRRKMVKIAGPTFSQKRITLQVLDEITAQIQRYLLVQVFTSVVVGLATWIGFAWIGLEHAAVWGAAAAILDFVPYLGSVVIAGGAALMGFLQFGTPGPALLLGGVSLGIHTVSAYLLTPWLTSRASRMNPVVIFVGVLAFGWLWGIWGLLLGAPILMAVKAVCDQVDDLKAVGELLGE